MNENIVNSVISSHQDDDNTDDDDFPVRMATLPVNDDALQQVGTPSSDDSLSKAFERLWAFRKLENHSWNQNVASCGKFSTIKTLVGCSSRLHESNFVTETNLYFPLQFRLSFGNQSIMDEFPTCVQFVSAGKCVYCYKIAFSFVNRRARIGFRLLSSVE